MHPPPAAEPGRWPPSPLAVATPSERVRVPAASSTRVWRIHQPVVSRKFTAYPDIVFHRGETVTVSAQGCAQIGGRGKTWRRYVDPRGPRSETLYHALVGIPGATATPGAVRLQDVIDTPIRIPDDVATSGAAFLILGFADDFLRDNGYYEPDEGYGCQCPIANPGKRGERVGYAEVTVRIDAPGRPPPAPPLAVSWGAAVSRGRFDVPLPRSSSPSRNAPACRHVSPHQTPQPAAAPSPPAARDSSAAIRRTRASSVWP